MRVGRRRVEERKVEKRLEKVPEEIRLDPSQRGQETTQDRTWTQNSTFPDTLVDQAVRVE